MKTVTRMITFTRNGKTCKKEVTVKYYAGVDGWVNTAGKKKSSFYGTTGYLSADGKTIRSYSGKILAEDVVGLTDICSNVRYNGEKGTLVEDK